MSICYCLGQICPAQTLFQNNSFKTSSVNWKSLRTAKIPYHILNFGKKFRNFSQNVSWHSSPRRLITIEQKTRKKTHLSCTAISYRRQLLSNKNNTNKKRSENKIREKKARTCVGATFESKSVKNNTYLSSVFRDSSKFGSINCFYSAGNHSIPISFLIITVPVSLLNTCLKYISEPVFLNSWKCP